MHCPWCFPTVLGFYLLVALGPHGPIGGLLEALGGYSLAFTFTGLVVGSVFYSLPFVIQPLQNAFSAIEERTLEAASTFAGNSTGSLFSVVLPMTIRSNHQAATLGFAHHRRVWRRIDDRRQYSRETQVLSIAIYDHVESLSTRRLMALRCAAYLLISGSFSGLPDEPAPV